MQKFTVKFTLRHDFIKVTPNIFRPKILDGLSPLHGPAMVYLLSKSNLLYFLNYLHVREIC